MMKALHVTALAVCVASEGLSEDALVARRNSVAKDEFMDDVQPDGSLAALWKMETVKARRELQHFLGYEMMSFSPTRMPTRAPVPPPVQPPVQPVMPVPVPTQPPETTPVLQPVLLTSMPTNTLSGMPIPTTTMNPAQEELPCLVGTTLSDRLLEILTPISSTDLLLNTNAPQGMAFNFLLNDPLVQTMICDYPTIAQRYSLATLYFSTSGADWTTQVQWLEPVSECEWFGIICDDDSTAISITLGVNNLAGPLPNEISVLSELDRLELFGNSLTMTLPTGFSNLTKLSVLDLEQNMFRGSAFPDEILSLTNLKQVFLSRNEFTGTIPPEISNWAEIQDFWFAENEIEGPIPDSLTQLIELRTLIMYENNLIMSIPDRIGNLRSITNLQLYENDLEGTVPLSLFDMSELTVLLLDNNFLAGEVAPDLGLLTQLTDLRLHDNDFQGTIPDEILFLSELLIFTLGENFLTGTVPDVFTDLIKLEVLDLGENFHTGSLPNTLFELPDMTRLYMQGNSFNSTIPETWSNPPNMVDLFLADNFLSGTIPPVDAGEFLLLQELTLQYNDLTGEVPQSVCDLRQNGDLDRFFTDCGGATPEIVCTFPTCCNLCFEGDNPERAQGPSRQLLTPPQSEADLLLQTRHSRDNRRR